MTYLQMLVAALIVIGLGMLAMAVGVIVRNKTFTSCACGSIEYKGEKIRCPACPEDVGESCAEKGGSRSEDPAAS